MVQQPIPGACTLLSLSPARSRRVPFGPGPKPQCLWGPGCFCTVMVASQPQRVTVFPLSPPSPPSPFTEVKGNGLFPGAGAGAGSPRSGAGVPAAGAVAHGGLGSDPTGWAEMGSCRTQRVTGLFVARPGGFAEPWPPQGAMRSAAPHSCSPRAALPAAWGPPAQLPPGFGAVPTTPLVQKGK